jgi:geranylgeranyl diphosphate synthase type II
MEFKEYFATICDYFDQELPKWILPDDYFPEIIHTSMNYSLFSGGKRIRPFLILESCKVAGGKLEDALPLGCAMELIHTYSLIHDDLPAMDNDDFRRGKPTNHKVYGEAIAILAGDGLLTKAFEILSGHFLKYPNPNSMEIIYELAKAAGTKGMIGGQVVDILSEGKEIDEITLKYIHNHKTGALLEASMKVGSLIAGGSIETITTLTKYGKELGLAFQITDDLLNVLGDPKIIGKPVGSDKERGKGTFPGIYGIERSKELAFEAVNRAVDSIKSFGDKGYFLKELALYIYNRRH